MLQLEKRPCTLGPTINARTQYHGEEPVPYMDITVSTLITAAELNDLMGEPHTADAWFENGGNKTPEPLLKHLQAYKLKGKFESSSAALFVGLKLERIDLANVTVATCSFEPQHGGMTALKCKVQAQITAKNIKLFLWMAREADIEIRFGELKAGDAQGELELEAAAETPPNDPPDDDDEAPPAEAALQAKPKRSRKVLPRAELN